MLLQLVLAGIPYFDIAIFQLPEGAGKRLEDLMRWFLQKESGPGQSRGLAMVYWDVVYKPT